MGEEAHGVSGRVGAWGRAFGSRGLRSLWRGTCVSLLLVLGRPRLLTMPSSAGLNLFACATLPLRHFKGVLPWAVPTLKSKKGFSINPG